MSAPDADLVAAVAHEGVDSHRLEFEGTVEHVDRDDVPALEDAPASDLVADGGDPDADVRDLADRLEAEGVLWE